MRTFHFRAAIAGVALMVVVSAYASKKSSAICSVPSDEMEVLSTYLGSSSSNVTTVVITTSNTEDVDVESVNRQLVAEGEGIPSEARYDLKDKTNRGCTLVLTKSIRNVRLITKAESDAMFAGRTGWREFHERFGRNAGVESLSRVGFSSDKHLAVFYTTDGIDWMGGSCFLYVFELKDGKWIQKTAIPVWTT